MCGISVVAVAAPSPTALDRLQRMHAVIPHRGPDDERFAVLRADGTMESTGGLEPLRGTATRLALAFRRLKVIDTSDAAAQPLASADGRSWIVFNGEIYNFRELRRELRDYPFRSRGDAEVALAAYERWGVESFGRLEGMWAIVIADLRRARIVGSRDRFGIKPLHWRRDADGLLLASEVRQILAAAGGAPRAHGPTVARFVAGSLYPRTEQTFFADVLSVPPASWFEWPLDAPPSAPTFHRYWSLEAVAARPNLALAYPDAVERLGEVLADAVSSHAVSDVPSGALLSGGLDSSTLVALLRERAPGPLPTFSFGFRDAAPELCELPYVDELAARHGLASHTTTLDAAWVAASTERVVGVLEEPLLAMAALAQFRVYELARERGVTVVFDGQGADEVLGGYPYHQVKLLATRLRQGRLLSAGAELMAIASAQGTGPLAVVRRLAAARLKGSARPEWVAPEATDDAAAAAAAQDRGPRSGAFDRQAFFDVRWGNVKIILSYADRAAMAHSIEARVPYFDRRLVELAFALPDSFKVGKGVRKRILRDFARRLLPPSITDRRDRIGFGVPETRFLREAAPEIADRVRSSGVLSSPFVRREAAGRMLESFAGGGSVDHRGVWRLFTLGSWARSFGVSW
jgi:asparagine synthase (glutamine-hydrolysing)